MLSDERLAHRIGLVIAVPMTSVPRPWATRVELDEGSYAIAEQPRTFSTSRVTRVDRTGLDVAAGVKVVTTLIGG
ncbi:MAG: hypothetical protein ACRCXL_02040 [Dermatophilaceae bacterium]